MIVALLAKTQLTATMMSFPSYRSCGRTSIFFAILLSAGANHNHLDEKCNIIISNDELSQLGVDAKRELAIEQDCCNAKLMDWAERSCCCLEVCVVQRTTWSIFATTFDRLFATTFDSCLKSKSSDQYYHFYLNYIAIEQKSFSTSKILMEAHFTHTDAVNTLFNFTAHTFSNRMKYMEEIASTGSKYGNVGENVNDSISQIQNLSNKTNLLIEDVESTLDEAASFVENTMKTLHDTEQNMERYIDSFSQSDGDTDDMMAYIVFGKMISYVLVFGGSRVVGLMIGPKLRKLVFFIEAVILLPIVFIDIGSEWTTALELKKLSEAFTNNDLSTSSNWEKGWNYLGKIWKIARIGGGGVVKFVSWTWIKQT